MLAPHGLRALLASAQVTAIAMQKSQQAKLVGCELEWLCIQRKAHRSFIVGESGGAVLGRIGIGVGEMRTRVPQANHVVVGEEVRPIESLAVDEGSVDEIGRAAW